MGGGPRTPAGGRDSPRHDRAPNAELISKTIDELVEPEALLRTSLPLNVTGAQAMQAIFATLHRAFPDLFRFLMLMPEPRG